MFYNAKRRHELIFTGEEHIEVPSIKNHGGKRLKIPDVARDTDVNRGTITRLYNERATWIDLEAIECCVRT
ncbi:helix-turn-helix domain-containing protein [Vibrio rotiferianus]|uniref:helix-turn-helix domain-containing protein n=1 Tax=Vibrio rotiferianus TaxID=190895 RepID=UPI00406A28D5